MNQENQKNQLTHNKRHLRADVLSLLSSALRPRLLSVRRMQVHNTTNHDLSHDHFSSIFSSNRGEKSPNVAKIVVMTTIFSIFGLFSTNFATPVSALSLTLTVPSDALSLNIQPTSTFTKSSPSSVSVKTDAFVGYSLSIKAQSSNELVNGSSKLTSISENQSEEQYQGEGNLNTWGYKPSKFNSLENTLFLPGPTTSPSVIETTKAANSDAATSYEFILAAKADATIAHGEYKNTFIFSATANTVSYNIKYELNDGQWSGTSPQAGNTAENKIKLDSDKPTRSGFDFLGWCDIETSNEKCEGLLYQPNDEISLSNSSNNINLYAVWKIQRKGLIFKAGQGIENIVVADSRNGYDLTDTASNKDNEIVYENVPDGTVFTVMVYTKPEYKLDKWSRSTKAGSLQSETLLTTSYTAHGDEYLEAIGTQGSYTYMQEFTKLDCSEAGSNVTDVRDKKSYTVVRLNDGQCWMTQNLRIENKTITPNDSDVESIFEIPESEGVQSTNWKQCAQGASYYLESHVAVDDFSGYYTWFTATAGGSENQNIDATNSICPKGWLLPHNGYYKTLIQSYNSSTIVRLPSNFILSGQINSYGNSSLLVSKNEMGYYWTSSGGDTHGVGDGCSYADACSMHFNKSSSISIDSSGHSCAGRAVRCIAV